MNRGFKAACVAMAAIWIVAITVTKMAQPPRDSVAYHLQQLEVLRKPRPYIDVDLQECLKPSTWRWFLRGRPSIAADLDEKDRHFEALVAAGYLPRRQLELRNEFRAAQSKGYLPRAKSSRTQSDEQSQE